MRHLTLLLVPALTLAAPVPKPTEQQKIEARFGKIVDPKGDSKFSLDGDKLTITLPANETRGYDYTTDPDDPTNQAKFKKTNTCPRVEFDAKGDFVLTVRVKLTLDAKAKAAAKREDMAYVAAGVQVMSGENDWHFLGPAHYVIDNQIRRAYSFDAPGGFSQGVGVVLAKTNPMPDAVLIRLDRTGERIEFATSTDGGNTFGEQLSNRKGARGETLRLALVAQHSSDTAHAVTFDEFKVEPVKK